MRRARRSTCLVLVACALLCPLADVLSCPASCSCDSATRNVLCKRSGRTHLRFWSLPPNTNHLTIMETKLITIPSFAFRRMKNVTRIALQISTSLRRIEANAFSDLPEITSIIIKNVRSLENIRPGTFRDLPKLNYLIISNTGIFSFPQQWSIHSTSIYFILEITFNLNIRIIPQSAFEGICENPLTLRLYSNGITEIKSRAFKGVKTFQIDLKRNNQLQVFSSAAFDGILQRPQVLDVSETRVGSLPSRGLEKVQQLTAQKAYWLKKLPPVSALPSLTKASLTYSCHCCAFREQKRELQRPDICDTTFLDVAIQQEYPRYQYLASIGNDSPATPVAEYKLHAHLEFNMSLAEGSMMGFGDQIRVTGFINESKFDDYNLDYYQSLCVVEMDCQPAPDDFNPCEDIMGDWFLRATIWPVALLAVLGNLVVLVVLLSSQYKLTVPRFLICNLAIADLSMGVYLLMVAVTDMRTQSDFHNHAIDWQNGSGCTTAGFLTVFASELSLFTLTAITMERWHAITHAMRLDRKMHLRQAGVIMLVAWILAITLSTLPLLGISSYSKVSICLPMDVELLSSKVYVIGILSLSIFAFSIICACYVHIYIIVHKPNCVAGNQDMKMAKRMAVLIFTDFTCIAPIAFFAISAALECPFITVSDSKIILVIFYPLNSCANPFLYALFTQPFRRDLFVLLGRCGLCRSRVQLCRGQVVAVGAPCTLGHKGCCTSSL
uniref:thyrotropin receptor-like n=2 Tax=Myxine glutinosa TaxID=7769 RepID=UPI00358FF5FD